MSIIKEVRDLGNNRSIVINQYEIRDLKGHGAFSKCYEVRRFRSYTKHGLNQIYILKVIPKEKQTARTTFQAEVKLLKKLDGASNRDRRLQSFWETQNECYLVLKNYPMGSLGHLMHYANREEATALSPDEIMFLMKQMLIATQELHDQKILHRDIKPENVVLDNEMNLTIIDFGLACDLSETDSDFANGYLGTPIYMAPQVIECKGNKDHNYSFKADLWSAGIAKYKMVYGHYPFGFSASKDKKEGRKSLSRKILKEELNFPDLSTRHSKASRYQWQEIVEILKLILEKKPQSRPSIADLLDNYFTQSKEEMQLIAKSIKQRFKGYFDSLVSSEKWQYEVELNPIPTVLKDLQSLHIGRHVYVRKAVKIYKYGVFLLFSNGRIQALLNNQELVTHENKKQYEEYLSEVEKFLQDQRHKVIQKWESDVQEPDCKVTKVAQTNKLLLVMLSNGTFQFLAGKTNGCLPIKQKGVSTWKLNLLINNCWVQPQQLALLRNQDSQMSWSHYLSMQSAIKSPQREIIQYARTILSMLLDQSGLSLAQSGLVRTTY